MGSNFYLIFVLFSLLSYCIVYYKKKYSSGFKYLFCILLLTLFVEILCNYRAKNSLNTLVIYNFFTPLEFIFYILTLKQIIKDTIAQKIIKFLLFIYPLLCFLNVLFYQGLYAFNSITYAFGCLLIIALCLFYFYELFKLQYAVDLRREPAFWICTGLLFFYCVSFPLFVAVNVLITSSSLSLILVGWYSFILVVLNCILYSLFSIAFLCKINLKKSLLS